MSPTTASPDTPSRLRDLSPSQRRAFAGAWFGYLLDGFDFVLITLVLTEVAKDFGLGLTQAATLVSAAFVSRWCGGLAPAARGDRSGRRPEMITSVLLFSLGSLLCGLSWGYWSLFAFRAVVGLGMAGEYGSSTTFVMESWPRSLRNRASGFLLSAYPIGSVLAAQAYALIVPNTSWRWLFVLGLVPAVLALILRRSLPEADEWSRARADRAATTTTGEPETSASVLLSGRRRVLTAVVSVVLAVSLVLLFSGNAGVLAVPLAVVVVADGGRADRRRPAGRRRARPRHRDGAAGLRAGRGHRAVGGPGRAAPGRPADRRRSHRRRTRRATGCRRDRREPGVTGVPDLSGVIPPVCTPRGADGELDRDSLGRLCEHL